MEEQNKIEIYQLEDNQTIVEVQFEQETVWLNRHQLATKKKSANNNNFAQEIY